MRMTIVFILLLTVTACDWLSDEFEVITLDDLNRLKCEGQEPKASQWFYIGSEAEYHKFVQSDLPGDKLYGIKTSEITIDNPMYVSGNKVNWVIMPWGPTYEECKQ